MGKQRLLYEAFAIFKSAQDAADPMRNDRKNVEQVVLKHKIKQFF